MADIEKFSIEIEVPGFVKLLEDKVAQEVLKEVEEEIRGDVSKLASHSARRIVSQRLGLTEGQSIEEELEIDEISEALKNLNLQLKKGEITKEEYEELKRAIQPPSTCSNCGKDLEEGALFCRFCGTKVS
ncbi:MAG: zinc-ribbon domain-containing protein [Candidatus Methanofastidiosia archaeon]